jgi:hypothetical protein
MRARTASRFPLGFPLIFPLTLAVGAALVVWSVAFVPAASTHEPTAEGQDMTGEMTLRMPGMRLMDIEMDPVLGRKLFAAKGCVACHAVNGVGGHDATPLDAHTMERMMNPFDFAAKMWDMAPYMITAQEEALGGQITFTGEELAHIIAFVHSDDEQHHFSEADIPPEVMPMMHHGHGASGSGVKEHAEEIGHTHGEGEGHEPSE